MGVYISYDGAYCGPDIVSGTDDHGIGALKITHDDPNVYCADTIGFGGSIPNKIQYVTPQNTDYTSAWNGVTDV